jgi:hypothetical protein
VVILFGVAILFPEVFPSFSGDVITVHLRERTGGQSPLQRLEAEREVHLITPDEDIRADRGTYDLDRGIATRRICEDRQGQQRTEWLPRGDKSENWGQQTDRLPQGSRRPGARYIFS